MHDKNTKCSIWFTLFTENGCEWMMQKVGAKWRQTNATNQYARIYFNENCKKKIKTVRTPCRTHAHTSTGSLKFATQFSLSIYSVFESRSRVTFYRFINFDTAYCVRWVNEFEWILGMSSHLVRWHPLHFLVSCLLCHRLMAHIRLKWWVSSMA